MGPEPALSGPPGGSDSAGAPWDTHAVRCAAACAAASVVPARVIRQRARLVVLL